MSTPTHQPSKPDTCAHQIFTKAVRSLHTRRTAPLAIPIPVNPMSSYIKTSTTNRSSQTLPWIAVELSNYPPQLTRADVQYLFKDFTISLDFTLPNMTRLSYPLRTFVLVAGAHEAGRAARDISGKVFGGRQIYAKVVDNVEWAQKEVVIAELADELKVGIINTLRLYYPHLTDKIFEVRERVQGAACFAFLQARDLVTVDSSPETHMEPMENRIEWEFIAAGRSDIGSAKLGEGNGRLSALRNLQQTIETQGVLKKMWGRWDGSWMLNTDA